MANEEKDITGISVIAHKDEAKDSKRLRMLQNQENFNIFHLNQDYSHKKEGQSKEFLPKQMLAVEQISSFLMQGLIDSSEWFKVENQPGVDAEKEIITPGEMMKLQGRQFEKVKMDEFISDSIKTGLLGSLMIAKVHGEKVIKTRFFTKEKEGEEGGGKKLMRENKRVWQLKLDLVRQEDYFPDPTGDGLYEVERIAIDKFRLERIANDDPENWNLDEIKKLNDTEDEEQKNNKSRETGQDHSVGKARRKVIVYEFWGTVLHHTTGKVLHEKVKIVVSESGRILQNPIPYPFWIDDSPYVVSPITRVPNSVWHRALMDAATKLNITLNELFNLMLDGGIMSVFGIKQLREHWLDDPSQVDDGVAPGDTLSVNTACPPGEKVLERIDTGTLSNEALSMFNMADREFQNSAVTNDTRLGNTPQRQTKATEIIAANQTITGLFNGIVKLVESGYTTRIVEKAWHMIAQNMDDLDLPEVETLLGEDRARVLKALGNEEIFANTVNGKKFKVFGMSTTLNRIQDFQKITSFLQTIAGSPFLMQVFLEKFDGGKLLGEIIRSLNIDEDKLKLDETAKASNQEMIGRLIQGQQNGAGNNAQSNITQVGNRPTESGIDIDRSELSSMSRQG